VILKDDFGVKYKLATLNAFVDNTNTNMSSQLMITPVDVFYPSPGYLELHDAGNDAVNNQTAEGTSIQDAILHIKYNADTLEEKNNMLEQKVSELEQKINTILRMDEITKI